MVGAGRKAPWYWYVGMEMVVSQVRTAGAGVGE